VRALGELGSTLALVQAI
jgi:L-serine kinase (ATP) / ParB family transcriptional regulator, heme-responsive regulator